MKKWIDKANFKKIWISFIIVALLVVSASAVALYSGFYGKIDTTKQFHTELSISDQTQDELSASDQSQDVRLDKHGRNRGHRGDGHAGIFNLNLSSTQKIILVTTCGFIGLVGITYWILMALWMTQKSRKDGANGALFGLLTLAFNLFAVAGYFVYRNFCVRCPKCGRIQKNDAEFCNHCGTVVVKQCTQCGNNLMPTDEYCKKCGTKAEKEDTI